MKTKLRQIRLYYTQNLMQQVYTQIFGIDSLTNSNHEVDLGDEYVDFYYDLSLVSYARGAGVFSGFFFVFFFFVAPYAR